ncbi:hypothetical protein DVA67_004545 [Solirubrobacter sp. CPCC 204708]|uniref:MBL fold metallo-hydrolase n=1 Tax=Solirubrobacter deserti TaxID=2282478 RepID=A0ABT4RH79_9ACTN|nr:hypothetical protein [Solirubrobacter deserti]MBE2315230.1 hypothetical protein [Solirubrobacter deserti]MDA0137914.1 hypothetical protein [Solirubrobacter deserti]
MIEELGHGIHRWLLRHPEWHPGEFGALVGSCLVHEGENTVLVDPLLDDEVTTQLDDLVRGEVVIAITIPYHVRNCVDALERWGGTLVGHPDIANKLPEGTPVHGDRDLPLDLVMHTLSRGKERPLELPRAKALVFGDRIVGVDGGLRYWMNDPITEQRRTWFQQTGAPALRHLLEIDFEHALVTHGEPVMDSGKPALEDALNADPWYHRPS